MFVSFIVPLYEHFHMQIKLKVNSQVQNNYMNAWKSESVNACMVRLG